jgi:hypothetical protein
MENVRACDELFEGGSEPCHRHKSPLHIECLHRKRLGKDGERGRRHSKRGAFSISPRLARSSPNSYLKLPNILHSPPQSLHLSLAPFVTSGRVVLGSSSATSGPTLVSPVPVSDRRCGSAITGRPPPQEGTLRVVPVTAALVADSAVTGIILCVRC